MLQDFSSAVFRSALQEDVFELFGRNVADACLSGSAPAEGRCTIFRTACQRLCLMASFAHRYNGSIYVYGQTGSGKTYTMQGAVVQSLKFCWAAVSFQRRAQHDLKDSVQSMHHDMKRCCGTLWIAGSKLPLHLSLKGPHVPDVGIHFCWNMPRPQRIKVPFRNFRFSNYGSTTKASSTTTLQEISVVRSGVCVV